MNSGQELIVEHSAIMKIVASLKRQADALSSGKAVPTAQLEETLTLLVEFADKCHHAKEEEIFFPALEKIPEHKPAVEQFLYEHKMSRANVVAMRGLVKLVSTDQKKKGEFVKNAKDYATILLSHIMHENILFAKGETIFSPDENARMAKEMEKTEIERIGLGKHDEYHKRAEELEKASLKL